MFELKNLKANIDDQEILKGLNLSIKPGEVHAIMGPNGSGKSTLSKVICGSDEYEQTDGEILFNGEDLSEKDPDERSLAGLFLGFQSPVEIPGVNNASFLRMAYNAKLKFEGKEEVDPLDFEDLVSEKLKLVGLDEDFLSRSVNHGFSGGEKKRNEILQLLVLDPKMVVLDEIDSGLDIDALKVVAEAVNSRKNSENSYLIITHYQRLLDYIKPDFVHVIKDGKIVESGTSELALKLEKEGYDWV